MTSQKALEKFDEVYNESYRDISRYVVVSSNNIGDVQDILQNIYLEVYKNIGKVKDKNYVFGIAKNVMKKYYRFKFMKKSDEVLYDNISDNINLEKSVMEKFDTDHQSAHFSLLQLRRQANSFLSKSHFFQISF